MYFKRLELIGFKSFCDKTILDFEPGITAVVGPNGCGKSNIFDSIRWVLGEQSVKAMRGSQMEDVIFNGSDSKEPLGMAEVTLTFDNSKRYFSVEYHEVAITRRIFRSGESEYLLNKTQVRLKDILDLLMGTGIGAESYSLVEQGKVELVLSSKPEDRRLVFDEASGITKYKGQKKEALRKLEETEQNLLRVNDIIQEVKRQIGSLERQASKARRYKEVFEELKAKEISSAVLQKHELIRQKDQIIDQLKELGNKEIELSVIIKEQESKISNRQIELKSLEDNRMSIRDQMLNLDNLLSRNKERINLNRERIAELYSAKEYLKAQIEQTRNRIALDEEKLSSLKEEYIGIKKNIEEKTALLKGREEELNNLALSTKTSLEAIASAKRKILDLVSQTANLRNEIADSLSNQQIYLARKKRLDIEKAKVKEEKAIMEDNLNNLNTELELLKNNFQEITLKIQNLEKELEQEGESLSELNSAIDNLEKQRLALESQKKFLEELKTKYEDISESMNAVIYLDKLADKEITGLVVKIKSVEEKGLKLSGEAKPINLDTEELLRRILEIEGRISSSRNEKNAKESRIGELNKTILDKRQDLRNQEMVLVNKKANQESVLEQFNKIKEEEGIITLELSDLEKDLLVSQGKLTELKSQLLVLERELKETEGLVSLEQNNINLNANLKEKTLVIITRTKTELDALTKRIVSEEATLKMLEDTYQQDKESLLNFEKQTEENLRKQEALALEIKDFENGIQEASQDIEKQNSLLQELEAKYRGISSGTGDVSRKIESDRKELDSMKNKLYELQMQNKDIDFKILSLKERILQSYKAELDGVAEVTQEIGQNTISQEIERLKEKLDSYGTVNLVAIEEYDELKKRYDFLSQQHNDLITAKDSLYEAIQKINRTTKKMFLETFEKVREEFRNYFRLLFNGGDAQIFLIDEQDPLESGIEIICRPPGKKLQNVLLLSGGEKSMSAIALIFAIFKIKPSPFCILDEIDAALDEANVDRFSRILQDFVKESQFIVITHNKKTIANADVMYGITMEESGVSKIVSVKFAKDKAAKVQEQAVEASLEPIS
ncbi:MAG: AAA family ATPase [Candidatus Omnitrophica bacterium]|nr:AAA family ATPase [Candidatus Omnitrophota bacterium]